MPLKPKPAPKGIRKRAPVDEEALALAVGKKLLAHLRREGGLKLNVWLTDVGAQANLGYKRDTSYTVEVRPHPLVAIERVLDLRTPGFHKTNE